VDGESHNFIWCLGHLVGLTETDKERAARISNERQELIAKTRHNDGSQLSNQELEQIRKMSDQQVDDLYKGLKANAEEQRRQNEIRAILGLPPIGPNGLPENLYRGGTKMQARPGVDVQIDSQTGLVKPGRGISLSDDANSLGRFPGGANEIDQSTVSPELEIKQFGRDGHYEVAPREPMTIEHYNELTGQIKFK
jgi:hypothetical protein